MPNLRSAARASSVVGVLAYVVLAAAALTGALVTGAVAATVAAVTVVLAVRPNNAGDVSLRTGVDRLAVAVRMLLTTAVVAGGAGANPAVAYSICAAVVLLSWSAVAGVLVAATTRHPACALANLDAPGPAPALLNARRFGRFAALLFNAVDIGVLAAVLLLRFAQAAPSVFPALGLGVAAAVAVATAIWLWPSLQRLVAARRSADRLRKAIEAYAPQAVVHLSIGAGQAGHVLGQWQAAFEALRLRTLVILREPARATDIGPTSLPTVLAPTGRDVARVVPDSVRVAFYAANGALNGDLLREPLVRHVFLNHGDSDKASSANPFNRVYDEVWVAGPAAVARYAAAGIDIPPDRFTIVGRPQLHDVAVGPRGDGDGLTVLYAPTFEGYFEDVNYSSLERMGPTIITTLLRRPGIRIIFKPHPATGTMRPGMAAAQAEVARLLSQANSRGGNHSVVVGGGSDALYRAFGEADVVITDVSSVATDFLWTERPIISTNPKGLASDRFAELFPTLQCTYVLQPDGSDIGELLDAAIGPDPLLDHRRRSKVTVLGDVGGDPLEAFAAAADRAYERAVERANAVSNTFIFTEQEAGERPR